MKYYHSINIVSAYATAPETRRRIRRRSPKVGFTGKCFSLSDIMLHIISSAEILIQHTPGLNNADNTCFFGKTSLCDNILSRYFSCHRVLDNMHNIDIS